MIPNKIQKIIDKLVNEWDFRYEIDEDEIEWFFDEAVEDLDLSLSEDLHKDAIKELTHALLKRKAEVSAPVREKIEIKKALKEDGPLTGGDLWNGQGTEKIELEVDLGKINNTVEDLIKNFGEDFAIAQIEAGMAVETEHSENEDVQFAIAITHLAEDPYYYDKLAKMEAKGDENADTEEDFKPEDTPEKTLDGTERMDDETPEEVSPESEEEEYSFDDSDEDLSDKVKDVKDFIVYSNDYGEGENIENDEENELPSEDMLDIDSESEAEEEEAEEEEVEDEEDEEDEEESEKEEEKEEKEKPIEEKISLKEEAETEDEADCISVKCNNSEEISVFRVRLPFNAQRESVKIGKAIVETSHFSNVPKDKPLTFEVYISNWDADFKRNIDF